MAELYRDYFDIDPEFFPAVNASVIEQHPNLWEKFYPHETFVNLMGDLIKCVSRQEKRSVWVEGEYGTGKSHAVLTLKSCWKRMTPPRRPTLTGFQSNWATICITSSTP